VVEIAIDVAQRQVLIGFAFGGLIRDVAYDERIDRQRGERSVADADAHEAVLAQRAVAVELARDRFFVTGTEDLREQKFVDERATRIVREDAVKARELAAQSRRDDREHDRYAELRQPEMATGNVNTAQ